MDQEMDEYKTPTSSRNNTQNTQIMILEDEWFSTTRNNTQQTDQDMNETLFSSQDNTQQFDPGMIENYEENYQEMNNEIPPKKRKRTTKKKDGIQDNESSTINKKNRRAPATTRKQSTSKPKSKKMSASQTSQTSQTIPSDTELPKEIINETSTSENQVKVKTGKNFWSLEDDKKLVEAVLMNLQEVPWSKIARENFPNRDRSGCYNRWNVIRKFIHNIQ